MSADPSILLLLGCFLEIGSLGFSEFRHGTRKPYKVMCARFFGKTFFALKNWGNGPNIFPLNLLYNENVYYLLCSCTNLLLRKNIVPEIQAKIPLSTQFASISPEQVDETTSFFACWYTFTKIKSWLKSFWSDMVKNECGQSGLCTLKLTVSQERTDGTKCFFACWYSFTQIKRWLNIFEVSMVKKMGVASLVIGL